MLSLEEEDYVKAIFLRPEFSNFVHTHMPFLPQPDLPFHLLTEKHNPWNFGAPGLQTNVEYNNIGFVSQHEYIVTSPLPSPSSPNSIPSSPTKVSPSPISFPLSTRRGKHAKGSNRKVGLKRTAKNRLIWTKRLQKRFLEAVAHYGVETARPKDILKFMAVEGLTRENVASHFQKYKQKLRRNQNDDDEDSEYEDDTTDEEQLAGGSPLLPFAYH